MSKPTNPIMSPRRLDYVRKRYISPHLLRVTFSGPDLLDFPVDKNGAHIKLFFPNQETGILQLPGKQGDKIIWPEHKPVPRAYSVRKYRPEVNELDIDFVAHGGKSPGSGWAVNAKKGDWIGLAGPAGPDPLLPVADWHIMAGDLTALPAISAILESLPDSARGEVFIEVPTFEDRHELEHPAQMQIHWLMTDHVSADKTLVNALCSIHKPDDVETVSAFIAGENSSIKQCRTYLSEQFGLSKKSMYAIPYWKRGNSEEAYHAERHTVMDEEY